MVALRYKMGFLTLCGAVNTAPISRRPLSAAIAQFERRRGGGQSWCGVLAKNVIFLSVVVEMEHISVVVDINKKVAW